MKRRISVIAILLCTITAFAQPVFKGGEQALAAFLKHHIVYPEFSSKYCIDGVVRVSFRVDKAGTVSNVKAYDGLGIDLDDEAVRVVKMTTGQWILPPNTQVASLTLPIRFYPNAANCKQANKMSRDQAVIAYRARQEQENAVTNYYENKYLGKADTTKENYILALKKQLEFDDELIDQQLEQAAEKLKQGDREGACTQWKFIRNIGSNRADKFLAQYCK
jgi:TonB family protein